MADNGSLLPTIIGAGVGLGQMGMDYYTNYQNLQFAKEQQDYSRYFAENATQIKMRDLEKAGINPLLAAGQSATSPAMQQNPYKSINVSAPLQGAVDAQQLATSKMNNLVMLMQANKLQAETMGQNIQNQYSEAIAQNQIEKQRLDIEFSKQSNPVRLQQQYMDVKGTELDNALKEIEARARELGITIDEQRLAREKIGVELDKTTLSEKQKQLAVLDVTIKLKEQEYDQNQYDYNWYRGKSLPRNYNQNPINGLQSLIMSAVGRTYDLGEYLADNSLVDIILGRARKPAYEGGRKK